MDALQAKVTSLLSRVEAVAKPVELAANYLPDSDDERPWWMPVPAWLAARAAKELLGSEEQVQAAGALRQVADLVPRWSGPDGLHFKWAQSGRRDDGVAYPVQKWLDEGDVIASGLAYVLGEVHEASALAVVERTVDATEEELAAAGRAVVETVTDAAKLVAGEWDWKVKAALWGGGAILTLGAATLGWQVIRATPLGFALRGLGVVAQAGAKPLGDAAKRAGASAREAIERAEQGKRKKA